MVIRKSWREFQDAKLLWWINRILHTFGWAIVIECKNGEITDVYPARVSYQGFSREDEEEGFTELRKHLAKNMPLLAEKDTK